MCVYIIIIAAILPVILWCMDSASMWISLDTQWLQVGILAGRALRERQYQYILEGRAKCVNVWGSVHWKGVDTWGCKVF